MKFILVWRVGRHKMSSIIILVVEMVNGLNEYPFRWYNGMIWCGLWGSLRYSWLLDRMTTYGNDHCDDSICDVFDSLELHHMDNDNCETLHQILNRRRGLLLQSVPLFSINIICRIIHTLTVDSIASSWKLACIVASMKIGDDGDGEFVRKTLRFLQAMLEPHNGSCRLCSDSFMYAIGMHDALQLWVQENYTFVNIAKEVSKAREAIFLMRHNYKL